VGSKIGGRGDENRRIVRFPDFFFFLREREIDVIQDGFESCFNGMTDQPY